MHMYIILYMHEWKHSVICRYSWIRTSLICASFVLKSFLWIGFLVRKYLLEWFSMSPSVELSPDWSAVYTSHPCYTTPVSHFFTPHQVSTPHHTTPHPSISFDLDEDSPAGWDWRGRIRNGDVTTNTRKWIPTTAADAADSAVAPAAAAFCCCSSCCCCCCCCPHTAVYLKISTNVSSRTAMYVSIVTPIHILSSEGPLNLWLQLQEKHDTQNIYYAVWYLFSTVHSIIPTLAGWFE